MGFQSKTYSLSDEVIEALERLKAKHGSYNKGLRALLIGDGTELHVHLHADEPVKIREVRQKGDKTR